VAQQLPREAALQKVAQAAQVALGQSVGLAPTQLAFPTLRLPLVDRAAQAAMVAQLELPTLAQPASRVSPPMVLLAVPEARLQLSWAPLA